jgi:hypothetical protein
MKKQAIALGALVIMASSLYGATMVEVVNKLSNAAGQFGINIFNKNLPVSEQNASLDTWAAAFTMAKSFVLDNCKNLIGSRDSNITSAMTGVENANLAFINSIINIRNIADSDANNLRAMSSKLATIKSNLKTATDKLSITSMTLSNKKNAKAVIISIGRFLEGMTDKINSIVLEKIRMSGVPTRSF